MKTGITARENERASKRDRMREKGKPLTRTWRKEMEKKQERGALLPLLLLL
jgi:hypothetical protein